MDGWLHRVSFLVNLLLLATTTTATATTVISIINQKSNENLPDVIKLQSIKLNGEKKKLTKLQRWL